MGCHLNSYTCKGRWTNTFSNIVYIASSLHDTVSGYHFGYSSGLYWVTIVFQDMPDALLLYWSWWHDGVSCSVAWGFECPGEKNSDSCPWPLHTDIFTDSLNLSSLWYTADIEGGLGWSLTQLPSGERRGTPWIYSQSWHPHQSPVNLPIVESSRSQYWFID